MPGCYRLERRQWVPRGLDETFAFFERPGNLAAITPPWLDFRLLTPEPIVMAADLVLDYRIRVLGVPVPWRSRIAEYAPPHAFRDVQVRGPYALWDHCHRFVPVRGGTLVEDEVRYRPPLGPLARLLDALSVARQLRAIFDYRRARIEAFLTGPAAAEAAS
jgi:ligand-binding SRPBCC domain-containing protein